MSQFRVRSKTWLEVDGRPFLGEGRYRLLLAVQQNGSINKAARVLGVSYRKAWAQLKTLEEISPVPLLKRRTGGRGGGETRLTREAVELMQRFESLCEQVNSEADRIYQQCFNKRKSTDAWIVPGHITASCSAAGTEHGKPSRCGLCRQRSAPLPRGAAVQFFQAKTGIPVGLRQRRSGAMLNRARLPGPGGSVYALAET